jgi:two-component system response regulator DesR
VETERAPALRASGSRGKPTEPDIEVVAQVSAGTRSWTFGRPGCLRRAMEAGAAGFLVKDGPVEELAVAIRRVLTGETVIARALAASALSAGPNPLTARECDALNASADGATVADIAAKLYLSESTVRNYLSSAIGKTGTRNRMEALREARQQSWL